jgi:hypothetical protein
MNDRKRCVPCSLQHGAAVDKGVRTSPRLDLLPTLIVCQAPTWRLLLLPQHANPRLPVSYCFANTCTPSTPSLAAR